MLVVARDLPSIPGVTSKPEISLGKKGTREIPSGADKAFRTLLREGVARKAPELYPHRWRFLLAFNLGIVLLVYRFKLPLSIYEESRIVQVLFA